MDKFDALREMKNGKIVKRMDCGKMVYYRLKDRIIFYGRAVDDIDSRCTDVFTMVDAEDYAVYETILVPVYKNISFIQALEKVMNRPDLMIVFYTSAYEANILFGHCVSINEKGHLVFYDGNDSGVGYEHHFNFNILDQFKGEEFAVIRKLDYNKKLR